MGMLYLKDHERSRGFASYFVTSPEAGPISSKFILINTLYLLLMEPMAPHNLNPSEKLLATVISLTRGR